MAPMVVLGAHDALPGRYWGEGQGPSASPNQASILLSRLNERARERKAGVRREILGVGQGRPGEGQGGQEGLGAEQRTPGHRTATAEEGKDTVLKVQYYSAEPTQMQPGGEVEPRVNGVKTEESCTGEVKNVKKKKRGRDEEEGESKGDSEAQEILTAQKEGLVSLLDGGGSVALITKKKSKREESQWEEELKPVISKTVDSSEESTLINNKKKDVYKNEISAVVEESTLMKRKKKNKNEDHVDVEMEISGGRDENYSETSENQRKKKKKKRGREVEETVDRKVENAHSVQLNDSQEEEDISLSSPANKKKNNKKDKKIEAKEEEGVEYKSSHDIFSSFKALKRKIKEEIGDTNEDLEIEQKEEELPINRHAVVGGDKKRRKDGHDFVKKKGKKNKKKTKREQPKSREVEGFTLLTEVEASKRQKVQRTLPHWLANPTVIGRDLMADGAPVDSLPGLDSSLKDLLKQQNIQQLFPVQRIVIPEILASAGTLACRYQPRDVCVSAPTGSGKTLAYVLPLVQTLKSRVVPRIRALVLLPVQELATQVYHVFQTYCRGTPLRVGKAVGHSTLQREQTALVAHHLDRYHSLIDILVATPGRLADHLRMTCGLDLSALRYLVLDEADRMLAAEGGDWVGHVQRAIADHQAVWENQPLPRPSLQRLLFSATLSSDPEQLQHVTLHHPKLFTAAAPAAGQDKSVAVVIGQYVRPSELREEYVVVEEEVKPLALYHLLESGERRQRVLVFTNSVHTTHKLALLLVALSQGSTRVVSEFSSKRDKRQQILSQFAAGKIDVLVSSDAMARGLDIPDIDQVVSYDVTSTTTYVHRIGRTARAGRLGTALSLVTKSTVNEFRQALSGGGECACQLSLAAEELEPYEQQYIDALASLKATLAEEEQQKRQNLSNEKRKKSKKKQRKKQRKQKRDLRTAQLAQKASKGKGKVRVNANHLLHLKRW